VSIDRSFLDEVFGDAGGYAHFAVGHGAYVDPTGKYKFGDWKQFSFLWPQQADDAIRHLDDVLSQPDSNDLYVCPNLLTTERRSKDTAVTHRLLHSDADNGADAAKLESLGAFAVASGRSGHSHIYVRLDRPVTLAQYQALQRGMREYFNGDNKIFDNDLLRPVGSVNCKAAVLDGLDEPYAVEWTVMPTEFRIDPQDAAAVLGVTMPGQGEPEPHGEPTNSSSTSAGKARGAPGDVEAFDLTNYRDIRSAIEKESGDRSADTHRIVDTCFRAGLRLPQIRWAVEQRPDLVERLDERTDDDILRIFVKQADADQHNKAAAHGANDIEAFDAEVAREHRTLRVREEAKRRLAAEKEGSTKPFDAGLLEDILARRLEPPFRIEGLLPSEAGMLVVAQRKTGKTTFELNLARSLVTGQRFLGRFAVRPLAGKIAILNFEVSGPQLAR
jgi:hypothetical protein